MFDGVSLLASLESPQWMPLEKGTCVSEVRSGGRVGTTGAASQFLNMNTPNMIGLRWLNLDLKIAAKSLHQNKEAP